MTKALLLIDVQKEYFPDGRRPLPEMDAALEPIQTLIAHFRTADAPIVFVQHVTLDPDPDVPFAAHTVGAELHDALLVEPADARVVKSFPNAFYQSWLLATLQGHCVSELVIAGAMTQTCIDSTVRSAIDFGYGVTVASDACVADALEWEGVPLPAAQVQAVFLAALAVLTPVETVAEITGPGVSAAEGDCTP